MLLGLASTSEGRHHILSASYATKHIPFPPEARNSECQGDHARPSCEGHQKERPLKVL